MLDCDCWRRHARAAKRRSIAISVVTRHCGSSSDADSSMFVERPSDVTDHQSKPLSDSCGGLPSRISGRAKHCTTSRQHRDFIGILRDRQNRVGTARYLLLTSGLQRHGVQRKEENHKQVSRDAEWRGITKMAREQSPILLIAANFKTKSRNVPFQARSSSAN